MLIATNMEMAGPPFMPSPDDRALNERLGGRLDAASFLDTASAASSRNPLGALSSSGRACTDMTTAAAAATASAADAAANAAANAATPGFYALYPLTASSAASTPTSFLTSTPITRSSCPSSSSSSSSLSFLSPTVPDAPTGPLAGPTWRAKTFTSATTSSFAATATAAAAGSGPQHPANSPVSSLLSLDEAPFPQPLSVKRESIRKLPKEFLAGPEMNGFAWGYQGLPEEERLVKPPPGPTAKAIMQAQLAADHASGALQERLKAQQEAGWMSENHKFSGILKDFVATPGGKGTLIVLALGIGWGIYAATQPAKKPKRGRGSEANEEGENEGEAAAEGEEAPSSSQRGSRRSSSGV